MTNKSRYTWAVEPTDLADDIYYIRNENTFDYPANDLFRQMDTSYAVIRKEDSYGLIGLDGQLAAELEYRGIDALSRFYLLERKEAVYDPEYQTGRGEISKAGSSGNRRCRELLPGCFLLL